MAINNWWADDPRERYWMEITDRGDMGADLRAPKQDAAGRDSWTYTLTTFVRPGDRVFHWHRTLVGEPAIVGWSEAGGPLETFSMSWQARGTGRERGVSRTGPAWRVPLAHLTLLKTPVTRHHLQTRYPEITRLLSGAQELAGGTAYLPFQNYGGRELRASQAYLTKFPASLVDALFATSRLDHEAPLDVADQPQPPRGQGFVMDASLRSAIEARAVEQAIERYTALGATEIEERGKPYDLRVMLDGVERHVEVKGSIGNGIDSVLVTQGEVQHAHRWPNTDLFVVDGIVVEPRATAGYDVTGGDIRWWMNWTPTETSLHPTQLRYKLPPAPRRRGVPDGLGSRPGPRVNVDDHDR